MRNKLIAGIVTAIIVAGAGTAAWYVSRDTTDSTTETATVTEKGVERNSNSDSDGTAPTDANTKKTDVTEGRYIEYDQSIVTASEYDTTILFFHAPWCPDCRAFDTAIEKATLPTGTQIVKVDYDTNQDLRQKYGVTVQTTFVRLDKNGEKQASWTGYGKDASVDAVLENTA